MVTKNVKNKRSYKVVNGQVKLMKKYLPFGQTSWRKWYESCKDNETTLGARSPFNEALKFFNKTFEDSTLLGARNECDKTDAIICFRW